MQSTMTLTLRAVAVAGLAACAAPKQQPQPPSPQPVPASAPQPVPASAQVVRHSLSGSWDWRLMFRGQPLSGTITFRENGAGYSGAASVPGMLEALVRSASVQGTSFEVTLESPRGDLVLRGRFEDRSTIVGQVEVTLAADIAAFSARRR